MAETKRRVEQHLMLEENTHSFWRSAVEFLGIVILVLALMGVMRHFVAQRFYIPSPSMSTTIQPHDYVLASKLSPKYVPIQRGDVVVFNDSGKWLGEVPEPELNIFEKALVFAGLKTDSSHQQLIKRVIGLPGDEVQCCSTNGKLLVNGIEINEPYVNAAQPPSLAKFYITVPEDRLWVMGDNRSHSADSRSHMDQPGGGTIPMSDVLGKAVAVIWPLSHFGSIDSSPQTFSRLNSK